MSSSCTPQSESAILSRFAESALDVLADGSQDSNVRQQVLMMAAMQFLGGNWSVLNKVHPQMVQAANELCSGRSEEDAAAALAKRLYMAMGENHEMNALLAEECVGGTDALGFTRDAFQHFTLSLLQTLRGAPIEQDFSTVIKGGTTSCVGQWLAGIATILKGGGAQLQQFVQKFCNVCSNMIAQQFPEKTMLIKMATPMVAGMLMQMYQQHTNLN
jgi:hypothetical protein